MIKSGTISDMKLQSRDSISRDSEFAGSLLNRLTWALSLETSTTSTLRLIAGGMPVLVRNDLGQHPISVDSLRNLPAVFDRDLSHSGGIYLILGVHIDGSVAPYVGSTNRILDCLDQHRALIEDGVDWGHRIIYIYSLEGSGLYRYILCSRPYTKNFLCQLFIRTAQAIARQFSTYRSQKIPSSNSKGNFHLLAP